MISKNMEQMISEQYHRELFSMHQYYAICSYFLDLELDGFANFFKVQAEEELDHAMRQFNFLHDMDGKISSGPLDGPQNDFDSIREAFEKALEHERYITKSIHQIVKAAMEEADFATYEFFQWFVREQVEEEATMRNYIAKLEMIGESKSALYMMNDELLQRQTEQEPEA